MEWNDYSTKLKELFNLKENPVSITYSMDPIEDKQKKNRACQALVDARNGKTIQLTAENQTCGGGNYYLGLVPLKVEKIGKIGVVS